MGLLAVVLAERQAQLVRLAPGHAQAAGDQAAAHQLHQRRYARIARGALPSGQSSLSGRTTPLRSG
jgi:hypothetical protein